MTERRILITAALPYANGPIHLGHLVEYIQTDIWVRFQRLRGNQCLFVCSDDTHGTAIMISAQRHGITEEEWIERISQEHQHDFAGFGISFDHYGSTNSPENRELCGEFWSALSSAGLIVVKEVEQLFDPEKEIFLADRFVKGTCPKCQAADQYGDNCDKCGATYTPAELIDPFSTLSGATPVLRKSTHHFVRLEAFQRFCSAGFSSTACVCEGVSHKRSAPLLLLLVQACAGKASEADARRGELSKPRPGEHADPHNDELRRTTTSYNNIRRHTTNYATPFRGESCGKDLSSEQNRHGHMILHA